MSQLTQVQIPPNLQILVPQMLCFAFQPAPNITEEENQQINDLERELQLSINRNNDLTELQKALQEKLIYATKEGREFYDKMSEVHRNANTRRQELQDKKIQLQHKLNTPRIELLDQLLRLKQSKDACKVLMAQLDEHKTYLLNEKTSMETHVINDTLKIDDLEQQIRKKQVKIDGNNELIRQLKKEIQMKMTAASVKVRAIQKRRTTTPPTLDGPKDFKEEFRQELVEKSEAEREHLARQAAANGNLTVLEALIDLGTQLNTPDKFGFLPLDWAALSGHVKVAEVLIRAGADVNSHSKGGDTPLHWAARKGQSSLAALLLDSGAELDVRNDLQSTPLHEAAYYGHLEMARLLLQRGADLNAGNADNNTPLHFAARSGHMDVVQFLEEQGADLWATNKAGRTPEEEAAITGKTNVAEWLENQ